jgi:hypothetical protein
MYFNVHCTNVGMYISAWLAHAKGWKSQTLYTTALHAATRE